MILSCPAGFVKSFPGQFNKVLQYNSYFLCVNLVFKTRLPDFRMNKYETADELIRRKLPRFAAKAYEKRKF